MIYAEDTLPASQLQRQPPFINVIIFIGRIDWIAESVMQPGWIADSAGHIKETLGQRSFNGRFRGNQNKFRLRPICQGFLC